MKRKWLIKLVFTIIIILTTNTIFLLLGDTYSILNPEKNQYFSMPNQKYLIVENILKNHNKYDTYIFGSSRVGAINPLEMNHAKAYNMTYGEGVPREHLLIIKLFLKSDIKIKNLLIGLDEFSYKVSFDEHQNQFIPKSHYKATNTNILKFYSFYFFRLIKKSDIIHFSNKFIKNKVFFFSENVKTSIYNQQKQYSNISYTNNYNTAHINHPIFLHARLYKGNFMESTLNDIKEIKNLCIQNDINVTFFINPVHKTTYANLNMQEFNKFKSHIALITDFYDFSRPNSINNNNEYWTETDHYNFNVGKLILNRIYNNEESYENFGIYIPKNEDQ